MVSAYARSRPLAVQQELSTPLVYAQDPPPPDIEPPPTSCGPVGTLECDDQNQCTLDACIDGWCVNTPLLDGSICDDLDPCTDGDMCLDGECIAIPRDCDDDNVCTSDRCDWVPEQPWFYVACFHDPIPGDCDDEDACTEDDACNEFGSCTGTQIDCDDGNDCTLDTCDPASGCVYTPVANGTTCNDEDSCTVNDICLYGACIGQRFRVCDDGNPCTDDSCATAVCTNSPNTGPCDDGLFCNGQELCIDAVCQTGQDPCPLQDCDEIENSCISNGDPIRGGQLYDNWMATLGAVGPSQDHPLWQSRPDQTSNTRSGAATWRCKECHGWDYMGADGNYATGTHKTGFPGILDSPMTPSELFTLLTDSPNLAAISTATVRERPFARDNSTTAQRPRLGLVRVPKIFETVRGRSNAPNYIDAAKALRCPFPCSPVTH